MTFIAEVAFRPEHFNPRCGVVIPARWTVDLVEGLPRNVTRIYSDGCETRAEAIADFIAQLRRFGLSGSLKLKSA